MSVLPSKSFRPASLSADRLLYWSFCALFFFLPIGTSPAVISGLLCLGIWIFSGKIIKDRQRWLGASWLIPVVVFMALPWVGLLWTSDMQYGLRLATKSHHWLFAFAIVSVHSSQEDLPRLLKAFLAGLTVVSISSILQALGVFPIMNGIPSVLEGSHITGSIFLVFGMALLAYFFTQTVNVKQKLVVGILMVLFLIALGVSGGRIGYVALIVLCPFLAFFLLGRASFIKSAVVVILILGVLFSFPTVRERFITMQSEIHRFEHSDPNSPVGIRLYMWKGAVRIFLDRPFLGTGTGGYRNEMEKFETPQLQWRNVTDPHNGYLYMASSFGIIGIISLLWLLYAFLKKGWHARTKATGFGVLTYGLVLCIASLSSTQILALASSMLFALLMGIRTESDNA
jgi:O-antigen ligase